MSKHNPLAGLIGNYGDSDDESDDGTPIPGIVSYNAPLMSVEVAHVAPLPVQPPGIHPAPIAHCPWSACYDESSGFTYYWNQHTNAVTWDAPPEYLLALKLAQQQLHSAGSTEVSAEEWQLYQQALAEKQNAQNKVIAKTPAAPKLVTKTEKSVSNTKNKSKKLKRSLSEDDVEKVELITSYHNSDSESEPETPVKPKSPPKVVEKPKTLPKNPHKKPKLKSQPVVEYGPSLPPNQNYSAPIGPEMPPELLNSIEEPKKTETKVEEEDKKSIKADNEDSQDESDLLVKLKNKAKILEKLGGEIPTELQKIIEDENKTSNSPQSVDVSNNIDELLEEIEKKELPKVKNKKIDIFDDDNSKDASSVASPNNSPKSRSDTPPVEPKPLFPSIKNINETEPDVVAKPKDEEVIIVKDQPEKKVNHYVSDANEVENVGRKKLRISNSVLPERKKTDTPAYTTKYSEFIEGFSSERTGLGFSKEDEVTSPKNTISYGNGLMFTKGETLNEDKKDDDLEDLTELVELKLKYLSQLQPCVVTPVQEMLIQMQTLLSAFRSGALSPLYWRKWSGSAADTLQQHEANAAPPGWTCSFQRSEGRYRYIRDSDGLAQWEYPATANMDMDISTTPPHPGIEGGDATPPPPPLPLTPPPPPPPAVSWQARTPPPPVWDDPPPPGCDDAPPLPTEKKQVIGDELASFYNDIAELEKQSSGPQTESNSREATPPLPMEQKERPKEKERERDRDREREKDRDRVKRKSKVKISASVGLKHKSVSSLVAKWQQVAEEIHSD